MEGSYRRVEYVSFFVTGTFLNLQRCPRQVRGGRNGETKVDNTEREDS